MIRIVGHMTRSWLSATGPPPRPGEVEGRSLLGHRLLLILREGPKSMRELHAATKRRVPGAVLRRALSELWASRLAEFKRTRPSNRGGRPRETWRLLHPDAMAVLAARDVVAKADEMRGAKRQRRPSPTESARPRSAQFGHPRARQPVPQDIANEVCNWVATGNYLRDYCRCPGAPCERTIYYWAAKDRDFRLELRCARDAGAERIWREIFMTAESAPASLGDSRQTLREFKRAHVWPLYKRLQRWRRHPRRTDAATLVQNCAKTRAIQTSSVETSQP